MGILYALFVVYCIGPLLDRLPDRPLFRRKGLPVKADLELVIGVYECEQKLKVWHRAKLKELDAGFALQEGMLRHVAACERARELGIGPSDPRYPDLFDTLPLR